MFLGVFLVSLFCFACSQPHYVPYVQSIEAIEAVTKQLEDQIMSMTDEIPEITDPRRHYAVLVTHLFRVAYILTSKNNSEYDHVFINAMPDSFVLGLLNVDNVISATKELLEKIDVHTGKLQTLVDTLCPATTTADACNQIIDQAVSGDDPRYGKEAGLLLHAGDMAMTLLDADLLSVAKEYDEQPYLINNMSNLNTFVLGIKQILNEVDPEKE